MHGVKVILSFYEVKGKVILTNVESEEIGYIYVVLFVEFIYTLLKVHPLEDVVSI